MASESGVEGVHCIVKRTNGMQQGFMGIGRA
jgi:hypothetical protein